MKIVNISFLIYGPILTTICCYGIKDLKGLASICTLQGISTQTNFVTVFVLMMVMGFALCTSLTMTMERTLDMA